LPSIGIVTLNFAKSGFATLWEFSVSTGNAHLVPIIEGLRAKDTVVRSLDFLAADTEEIPDDTKDGDKQLSMSDGLEAP
jgi:hypothetical protein